MKKLITITVFSLIGCNWSLTQTFVNPDLDGSICLDCSPTSWNNIPFTDPASTASGAAQATVDVLDPAGPSLGGGINGNPYSGATLCSGLHASDGSSLLWHEGIMQTVSGFTVGQTYSICFYQAVVKQHNCLDESGSWQVYLDGILLTTTAPSNSNLSFDSNSLAWNLRTVTFIAKAVTHTIKFIAFDDDANIVTSMTDISGGLRMGIDLIQFSTIPDPSISTVGPYCNSDPSVFLTSVDPGGTWSGTGIINQASGEFDPSVAGPGTWTVYYNIAGTCGTFIDSINIIVNDCGSCDPSWTPTTICADDTPLDLNTLLSGDPGGTWSGTGVTGGMFDPSAGTQTITYTNAPPCNSFQNQTIQVIDITPNMTSIDITCNGLADGSASVSPSGGSSYTFNWSTTPPQSGQTINNLSTGNYYVTITDDSGCSITETVEITEPDLLVVSVLSQPVCGDSGSANTIVSGGTCPYSYAWSPAGGSDSLATSLIPGIYTVDVTDAFGCTVSGNTTVIVYPFPVASVSNDTSINYGESIVISAGSGEYFQWTPSTSLSCSDCANPLAFPHETTEYCVRITDINGCSDSACTTIYVELNCGDVFVPSAFSPNGIGDNELKCVYGNCIETMTFQIYDRWGEKIFESTDKDLCWDGTHKGEPMSSGIFVYVLEATLVTGDKISKKGNISLVR